jgi:hypothetical protein
MVDPATAIAIAQVAKAGYDLYKGNKSEKEQQHIAKFRERRAAKTAKKGTRELDRQIKKDILPSSLKEIQQRMQQAGTGSDRFYQPVVQQAVNQFNQKTVPNLITQYGGGSGSRGGSPMRLALAEAGSNLSNDIAATLAGAKERYANNIFGASQQAKQYNAQNRMNAAQFGVGQPSAYIPQTNQQEQAYTNAGALYSSLAKKYPKFGEWTGAGGETPPINQQATTTIGG